MVKTEKMKEEIEEGERVPYLVISPQYQLHWCKGGNSSLPAVAVSKAGYSSSLGRTSAIRSCHKHASVSSRTICMQSDGCRLLVPCDSSDEDDEGDGFAPPAEEPAAASG